MNIKQIINLNITTIKTLKQNSSTNIITLNNKTYIPFQLHQLPKNYNEIPLSKQFSNSKSLI